MGDVKKGALALISASVIWGIAPLYFKQLVHIDPVELLSHRILWSLVFFVALLGAQKRLGEIPAVFDNRRMIFLTWLAAVFITINWFLFIWAIQVDRAVQASLGYYIFPLFAVVLGRVVYAERLTRLKWVAVSMAAIAVVILTVGLGEPPWISLILASTFGLYGLLKKSSTSGPVVSVVSEVLLLAPMALIWLWGVHWSGWQGLSGHAGGYFGGTLHDTVLLMLAGPITAAPLILFSYGAKRLTMASVGLIQYVNPTLQFAVAVLIFREPIGGYHAVAFGLIWLALAIYSGQALLAERAVDKASTSDGTSENTVT
ncbi:MAG: EamA family transporter RarD [Paracoccaceae bacterium]